MSRKIFCEFEKYAAIIAVGGNQLESIIERILSPQKQRAIPLSTKKTNTNLTDRTLDHDHHHGGRGSGPLGPNYVTSPYGSRTDPKTGRPANHSGIDLRAAEGAPVYSFDNGTVTSVSSDAASGNFVAIKHKGGFSSSYSHLSQQDVRVGDEVSAGQRIGLAGQTGRVTAPHVHFRLNHDGSIIDPTPYLQDRRIA